MIIDAVLIASCQEENKFIRPKALKTVIINSIKVGGTSIRDYVDTDGQLGNYALQLNVYGRKKQKCLVCESPIQFIKLGQRGTHFCSNCQT